MDKAEYAEYQEAIATFFKQERITHLVTGHYQCPECLAAFDDHDRCPQCGTHQQTWNAPYFAWRPCDCCCSPFGGLRVFAAGWNHADPPATRIKEYSICTDCEYYNEYRRLDDRTMLDVEKSAS